MNDTIRMSMEKLLGDMSSYTYTQEEIMSDDILQLYSRLLGTDADIFCNADTYPSVPKVLALVLIHYGSISTEQFCMLFPSVSKGMLAFLAAGKKPLLSRIPYVGHKTGYVLTADSWQTYTAFLPPEYRKSRRIGEYDSSPIKNTEHSIAANDVPYRLLSGAFPIFESLGHVRMKLTEDFRIPVKPSFVDSRSDDAVQIPDSVFRFSDGGYLIVEQDMCTERQPRLLDKHRFYGKYFDRFGEISSSATVLFCVAGNYRKEFSSARRRRQGSLPSYAPQFKLVKHIMEENGLITVEETLKLVRSRITASDVPSYRSRLGRVADFLEEFLKCGSPSATITELSAFFKAYGDSLAQKKKLAADVPAINRCLQVENALDRWISSDDPDRLPFLNAVRNGRLSYVIASRGQLIDNAEDMLATLSNRVFSVASLAAGGRRLRQSERTFASGITKMSFKNTFSFETELGGIRITRYIAVEEISFDYAGRIRCIDYLNAASKPEELCLCMMVASAADAELVLGLGEAAGLRQVSNMGQTRFCFFDYTSGSFLDIDHLRNLINPGIS